MVSRWMICPLDEAMSLFQAPDARTNRTVLPVLILAAVLLLGAPGARAEEGEKTTATNWHALLVGVSEYPVLREKLGEERYKARRVALKGPPNDVALMRDLLL